MNLSIRASDNDLLKRIQEMRGVWVPESMEDHLEELADEVIEELVVYPPLSEANNPPPPFYTRGIGYTGRSGKITKPSQQLNKNWRFDTNYTRTGKEVTIRNPVTYAGYVQDEDFQTPFHAKRGWKTVQGVVRSKTQNDGLVQKLRSVIDGLIQKL